MHAKKVGGVADRIVLNGGCGSRARGDNRGYGRSRFGGSRSRRLCRLIPRSPLPGGRVDRLVVDHVALYADDGILVEAGGRTGINDGGDIGRQPVGRVVRDSANRGNQLVSVLIDRQDDHAGSGRNRGAGLSADYLRNFRVGSEYPWIRQKTVCILRDIPAVEIMRRDIGRLEHMRRGRYYRPEFVV